MTSDSEQNSYICLIYNSLQLSISGNVTQSFVCIIPKKITFDLNRPQKYNDHTIHQLEFSVAQKLAGQ